MGSDAFYLCHFSPSLLTDSQSEKSLYPYYGSLYRAQNPRAVRANFGPGVNLFIYRFVQKSAAARSTLITFGCKTEES